jgi:hypothetical protein
MATPIPFGPAEDSKDETARLKVKQKLQEQINFHKDPLSAKLGEAVNTLEKISVKPVEEVARLGVPAALGKIPVPVVSSLLEKGAEAALSYKIQSDAQALTEAAMKTYRSGGAAPGRAQLIQISGLLEESTLSKIRNSYQNLSAVLNGLAKKAQGVPEKLDDADKILWSLALGELSLASLAENLKFLKFYVEVMETQVKDAEATFESELKPALLNRQTFYYMTHPDEVEKRRKFVGEEVEMTELRRQ